MREIAQGFVLDLAVFSGTAAQKFAGDTDSSKARLEGPRQSGGQKTVSLRLRRILPMDSPPPLGGGGCPAGAGEGVLSSGARAPLIKGRRNGTPAHSPPRKNQRRFAPEAWLPPLPAFGHPLPPAGGEGNRKLRHGEGQRSTAIQTPFRLPWRFG
jgi:hypothetical protein